jgi:VCBS repeat-containing protein
MSGRGFAANSVATENSLAGNPSSEWEVNGIGDPSIQGFATDISVNRGSSVSFKIKTTAAAYRIDIYRLGYYAGRGARKVATIMPSASLPQIQPAYLRDNNTGLVDCGNWGVSATWAVPATATSGVYIARPVRTDTGGASHMVFIVRDDAGASDFLFQTSDTTWHAYNRFGGVNLYNGNGPATDVGAGRAYKVSYNRPFNNRAPTSAGEKEGYLFNSEYPMIRWMEANGYDVSYAAGIDTDRRGAAALKTHKVFLSVGHDEYWSGQQRANVESARAAGVHLGFFSANEVYWKTRWENSIAGPSTPYRTLVCYKETHSNAKIDPSPVWTGTWRDPRFSPPSDGGRPENSLSGQFFTVDAFHYDPITISSNEGKLRFWRNTSVATLANGQTAKLPAGVLGFEFDEVKDNGFLPSGLFRLSTTSLSVARQIKDYGTNFGPGTATHSLTLYRHSSGALVFGAGTIQWPWGLDATHDIAGPAADPRMQQATVNLFADMGVQPLTLQPGLVPATESSDTVPPTSIIQGPPGGVVKLGSTVTTFGTATDTGGGRPVAVEFSSDGGVTWRPATGTTNWSATWTLNKVGPVTLKSRATDDSARTEIPGPGVTINARGPSVLVNGSFESDFAGWTVAGNQSIATGAPYAASHGTKLAIFNSGNSIPNGVVSQTFPTVAGQTYTLEFDAGVLAYNYSSQTMLVTVTGASGLLSKTITVNGAGGGIPRWMPQSFTFVANSATTTLSFRDQSSSTGGLDMTLDDIWVGGPTGTTNTAPVAVADTYSTFKNTALIVPSPGVLANDTDAQSNMLTAVLSASPTRGALTLNPNGSFTYTPANDFTGGDTFTYRARDGSLDSNVVTVSINIGSPPSGGLANGSFESNFTGWTQTGNATIMASAPYVPTQGTKLVAFNSGQSTPNGVLSQSFGTTAGQTYTLQFDAGVLAYNTNPQTLQVTVTGSGAGSLLSQTITINGLGGGANRWLPQSFNFVANSAAATLTFRDQSTSSNSLDLLLDNVRVTGTVALLASRTAQTTSSSDSLMPTTLRTVAPPLESLGTPSITGEPGNISIHMIAPQAGTYVLEISEDLVTWQPLTERYCDEQESMEFHDPASPAPGTTPKPNLFYRIALKSAVLTR